MSSGSDATPGAPPVAAADVMAERPQLIGLAYRLVGSFTDAEDVVQEAYARWLAMSPQQQGAIRSPGAWLSTVTSRICLDLLDSARVRRERYVGEWLPEPLPDRLQLLSGTGAEACDPVDRVTLDESLSMAFVVLLEAMTPAERVAFVLHDVFGYPFSEVAEIVGRTPAACRQLASSARRRVRSARPTPGPSAGQAAVVRSFRNAWAAGDIDALLGVLDPEVRAVADGGGAVEAQSHAITGAHEVSVALLDITARIGGFTLEETSVNGEPGLMAKQDGVVVTVFAFDIVDGRISRIWAVRNPAKLRSW